MEESEFVLSSFSQILKTPREEISLVGEYIPIPSFSEECVLPIIESTIEKLQAQSPIINIEDDVIIVGDLHGNFHDLIRIFNTRGLPPRTNYLFLGDYVDRGDFQIECIILLYALYNLYPNSITLLRGNHEFREINAGYGFRTSIIASFNDLKIWEKFNDSFAYLPLVAILQKKYFCCHGGIPSLADASKLHALTFPIEDFSNPIVEDLMWGDPTCEVSLSGAESIRGRGHQFGRGALSYFLSSLGFNCIIRAHQCVDGIDVKWSSSCITVFSTSGYRIGMDNSSGHIYLDKGGQLHKYVFPKISKVSRKDCTFFNAIMPPKNEGSGQGKSLKWSGLLLSKATTSTIRQSSFIQKKTIVQPLPKRRVVSAQRVQLL